MAETVKLSASIQSYTYDKETQRLYVHGMALAEGVWHGLNSRPLYFPAKVVIEAAPLFRDVPIACEHNNEVIIGRVYNTTAVDNGFTLDGYITNQKSIQVILSGEKRDFSIEGNIIVDPVTSIVEKIISADNVSLVSVGACRVCSIDKTQVVKNSNGGKLMAEEKSQGSILEELKLAAARFVDLKRKFTNSLLTETESVEDKTQLGLVDDIKDAAEKVIDEAVEDVKELVDEIEQKVEEVVEDVTGKKVDIETDDVKDAIDGVADKAKEVVDEQVDEAASEVKEELEEKVSEITDEIKLSGEVSEIKSSLSTMNSIMEEIVSTIKLSSETITALTTRIEALETALETAKAETETAKATLSAKDTAERTSLISEIKKIDPNTNDSIISTMDVAQLSAYKEKVEAANKPKVGGVKLSAKKSESTVVEQKEQPKYTVDDLLKVIMNDLAKKQI